MTLRATSAAAVMAVLALALTGCLGSTPEPTPTPTAVFSSEEEAFQAAEATYRAYIDAVNARRADPQSQPDPQSFLVGEALEADIESLREADQLGIHLEGKSVVTSVTSVSADPGAGDVVIRACYDSSGARVVNEDGKDVTIADRDATVLTEIHLIAMGSDLAIDELLGIVSDEC